MTGKAISSEFRLLAPKAPLGWPLLQVPDEDGQGQWEWPDLETSLKNQIYVILKTRPGEQLMSPDFGAGLEDHLHEPDGIVTRTRLRDLIASSLKRWESRIVVDRVIVEPAPSDAREVLITVSYHAIFNAAPQVLAIALPLGTA